MIRVSPVGRKEQSGAEARLERPGAMHVKPVVFTNKQHCLSAGGV